MDSQQEASLDVVVVGGGRSRGLDGPGFFTVAMKHPPLDYKPGRGTSSGKRAYLDPIVWGLVVGGLQAASPLAFWWLDAATVYAVGLAVIASIYIGFAVADGRRHVIMLESIVATVFIIVATAAITGSPWLLVLGFAGHGLKDLWQHRRRFLTNTRWWPPFCFVVDWVVAVAIIVEILAGVRFHQ